MGFVIIGIILVYATWVIYRKVKAYKRGEFCSCGCSDCPSKKKCHEK